MNKTANKTETRRASVSLTGPTGFASCEVHLEVRGAWRERAGASYDVLGQWVPYQWRPVARLRHADGTRSSETGPWVTTQGEALDWIGRNVGSVSSVGTPREVARG